MATQLGRGTCRRALRRRIRAANSGGLMTLLNGTAELLERQHAAIEELNQKLRQSQKMEAIGQLTGGVAHDFNNLLTVILGNAEHLAEKLAAHPELHSSPRASWTAAERGADLTRSLLAFARKQPLMPRTSTSAGRSSAWSNCCAGRWANISSANSCSMQDLWLAIVDPGQLASAMLNLVLNARDAMPNGGKLTVEAAMHRSTSRCGRNGRRRPGDYVMVAVTDTGSGMTRGSRRARLRAVLHHEGRGQGHRPRPQHGLRLCAAIRRLDDRSSPKLEHGTAVTLFFPRVGRAMTERSRPSTGQLGPRPAAKPFSLVEDDDMVRAMSKAS